MISFDTAEEDDFREEHTMLEDGTMQYTYGARKGMLFHPYDWEQIEILLKNYNVIYKENKANGEKIVILQK